MSDIKVTVTHECVLDNHLWGIDGMAEEGILTIENLKEFIKEDLLFIIEESKLFIKIEGVKQ